MTILLTQADKGRIKRDLINLPFNEWVELNSHSEPEQKYILFIIKNQRGCSLETNGTHAEPNTITKYRKLNTDILNKIIKKQPQ